MVEAARARAIEYDGSLSLQQADVQLLPFADSSFDTIATASTFCSVADPVQGLKELYRVLKPGGAMLMFEHVRSRKPLLGLSLDFLTLATRYVGPAMNRDTVGNVQRAGFVVDRVVCAYLDIFLAIEAHKPSSHYCKDILFSS
jgi:ubiquinone/menaquinone biosynthesis C-methylase UbiE